MYRMQQPSTMLWILLLLAVQVCRTMSHGAGPYCKRNIRNSLVCKNWNSTKELNYNIINLASANNIGLEDIKQLSIIKSNTFVPNELSVGSYLKLLSVVSTDLPASFEGFGKFSSLEYLIVHGSNLEISEHSFLGLGNLKNLDLLNNNIKYFPENWQNSLTSLRTLSLPDNNVQAVDYKSFKGLYHLEVLDLSYNIITKVSADSFQDLARLSYLYLNNNKIGWLPKGSLEGLYELLALDLSDNTIESLEPEMFKDLENLKNLTLNGNLITALKQSHFVGLKNLQTLEIDHNNITALSADLFKFLPQIQTINLDFNNIGGIQSGAFAGLTRLKSVYLSDNNLVNFPIEAFDDNSALVILYLSNNKIRGFDNINCNLFNKFPNLPSAQTASCSHSKKLVELTILNLENNHIRELELSDLEWLPKLEYIQLDGNMLDSDVLETIYNKYEPIYYA